jgi:hypothetical protein
VVGLIGKPFIRPLLTMTIRVETPDDRKDKDYTVDGSEVLSGGILHLYRRRQEDTDSLKQLVTAAHISPPYTAERIK